MPSAAKADSVFTRPWGTNRRYNSYRDFFRKNYGQRVQKVSVDAGFTCPNRDGTQSYGGCTYCNNKSFVPPYCRPGMSIAEQVREGIDFIRRRYGAQKFIVYFQAYSNTYAPLERLKFLYGQALNHPDVIGISIGTRPDCVDGEKIRFLESLAKTHLVTVEYGLESTQDRILQRLNRRHGFQEWAEAVALTAGRGIRICSHLILGLPGESKAEMLCAAEILSEYPLDFLKLHHLHVVRKTILAYEYAKKPFPLLGYREYIDLVVEFLQRLKPDICLQRLVGETHPRHLIGPLWGVRAGQVYRDVERKMEQEDTWQGKLYFRAGGIRRSDRPAIRLTGN